MELASRTLWYPAQCQTSGIYVIHFFCMNKINLPISCSVVSDLTLCDPMDCSPPGSSVHGILQARVLEWVAIPFS